MLAMLPNLAEAERCQYVMVNVCYLCNAKSFAFIFIFNTFSWNFYSNWLVSKSNNSLILFDVDLCEGNRILLNEELHVLLVNIEWCHTNYSCQHPKQCQSLFLSQWRAALSMCIHTTLKTFRTFSLEHNMLKNAHKRHAHCKKINKKIP